MNKYTGQLTFKIGKKTGTLCYDWKALAEIKSLFSASIVEQLNGANPDTIADLMAIGFKKYSPEITKEDILADSPPLVKAIEAIGLAVSIAHFGPDEIPEQGHDIKKKTKHRVIIFVLLSSLVVALVYLLKYFGL